MLQGIKNEISNLVQLASKLKFNESAAVLNDVSGYLDVHFKNLERRKQNDIKSFFEETMRDAQAGVQEEVLNRKKDAEKNLSNFLNGKFLELQKMVGVMFVAPKASAFVKNATDSASDKKDPLSMVLDSITHLFKMTMGANDKDSFKQLGRELPRAMIGILTGILSMLLPESIINKITKFTAPLLDLFDKNLAASDTMADERRAKASKKAKPGSPDNNDNNDNDALSKKSKSFTPSFNGEKSSSKQERKFQNSSSQIFSKNNFI